MSLKSRFLLLTAALILLASAASWVVFHRITEGIIEQWGERVAAVQVRYDSARLLQPLEREIALSRQMANSIILSRWARDPDNPALKAQAIAEMENFRRNFAGHNYFVALRSNGAYYHNNADNEHANDPFQYRLREGRPADAWFFRLIEEGRDFHLNVNPDVELGVTKLWVDVLIRDEQGEILGIVGTGLPLEHLVEDIIDLEQPGITTLFADYNGAIQLYRDRRLIDYASFVKPEGQKRTLDLLVDLPQDAAALNELMAKLRAEEAGVEKVGTRFVTVNGQRHLAGIAFLPSIGWFEITLLDLNTLMPLASFTPVAVLFVIVLLGALFLFHIAMQRQILRPIAALRQAMGRIAGGDLRPASLPRARGEMAELMEHFQTMAGAVRHSTEELEQRVRERTEALERVASQDVLTGLMNRRGMQSLLRRELDRVDREGGSIALVWLDLDRFKELNDQHGHGAGDRALVSVAELLREDLRPYDQAARWGGDEFLILLSPCDAATAETIARRLCQRMQQISEVTISAGVTLNRPGDDQDSLLQRADEALYQAKSAGRNTVRLAAS